MSNSNESNPDNVIPFRPRDKDQTAQPQKRDLHQKICLPKTTLTLHPSMTPEHNTKYIRSLLSKGNPTDELVNQCAPSLVRRIIRHVRMRNRPNVSLPKILPKGLRRQLQLLIDFNHPAGRVLKDWLDGNRQSLPDGFEETYARISNRKEANHE